jgi:hypothetical protein
LLLDKEPKSECPHWRKIPLLGSNILLTCQAQKINISKMSANCYKMPKTETMQKLEPYDPANGVNFCNWILQSGQFGEISPLILFPVKFCFTYMRK